MALVEIERWSADRLGDGTVTLLRSRLEGLTGLDELVRRLGVAPVVAQAPSDAWSDEVEAVLASEEAQAFILDALPAKGDGPRPLREGDVYVVRARGEMPPHRLYGPDETTEFLAGCRRAGARIIDMTAPARQAVKVTYGRVVQQQAPSPEPPAP